MKLVDSLLVLFLATLPLPVIAQVTPLGSTIVTPNGSTQTITGGTPSTDGGNLFHRFDQFNLTTGQRALFESNASVQNILTRINQSATIDGILQVNGKANLFLLSPSGILFGPNAKLNLNGNFFATSATGIQFQNGIWSGENDPRSLVGDPSHFIFALSQPSAILNAGKLQNPNGTLALVGGEVANTGTLNANQVAIVAVPGNQRVQIGDPNGVLKFEFQPLPGQTINETLQNWTPNRLSDLIAKGNQLNHATQLEVQPDGSVRVVGSSLTIANPVSNPGQSVLVSGTIAATTAQVTGDQVLLDSVKFNTNRSTQTLFVEAASSLWLSGSNTSLNFGQGETVTLKAGTSMIATVAVLSQERDLIFQAPIIKTQLLDSSIAGNEKGGAIRLEGLDGKAATAISFSNLVTPHRDVALNGDRITGQFIITNAKTSGNPGLQAGEVTIASRNFVGIGGAITDGQSVTIQGDLTQATGTIQSGLILSNGGNITLSASRLNAGTLWASARDNNHTNGNSGNITLNATTKLTANRLEANGKDQGQAGNVVVTNASGDVLVDSVQAYGGVAGGTIDLTGDRIRITGTALDPLVPGQSYQFSSLHAGERISITHQGGDLNQDFIIGNSTINGSNGKLVVGTETIAQGTFALNSQTQVDRPIPGLTITGINTAPHFPGNLTGFPITVTPGLAKTFTLSSLGLPNPQDSQKDRIRLYVRPRPGTTPNGKLFLSSGTVVTDMVEITTQEQLVYRPTRQLNQSILDQFEIIPLDLPVSEAAIAQAHVLPLVFATQLIPQQDTLPAPTPLRQVELPEDSGMSNVSLSEVASLDREFAKDFEGLGADVTKNIEDSFDGTMTREIEQKTGVRPAIVYLRTLRRSDPKNSNLSDTLEFTILTSRGRFRRKTAIDAALLETEVAKFRREITNPIRTHTTSYLPMAQKLYGWMITPILKDLNLQGITNLVFIPEAGLRGLPYAALHDGKQFLIEQYSVGMMPSLGLVQTGYRNLRNSGLLSVGISQSTQGQTALPMVEPELIAIQKIWGKSVSYLNDRATFNALQGSKQTHPFQILHLATHANFIAGKPKEAYIQLWNDRLRLEQLRQLDWNKPTIDLMVLSACKTAVGDRDSELGFAGLALQSGVKTAIASLWSVSDTATMGLISSFYAQLSQSPVKSESLRQAQIAMLKGDIRIQDGKLVGIQNGLKISLPSESIGGDTTFRHPYYWSAFTVVGNPW